MAEWKDKGNSAFQAGDYAAAIALYTTGIELDPSNAALFSNRSAAHLKSEDFAMARRDADMCIELDPLWPKGWWRRGMALLENQDYKGARATFQEGLSHCPGDENLVTGVAKADKYIAVLDKVQGPQAEPEFDPDAPSTRQQQAPEEAAADAAAVADSSAADNFPGSPEEEIKRIKNAPNHYATLHVSTDASSSQMKKNYYTLARMLHPDKCQLPGADDAMTTVSLAYDTLTNVVKKTLYDQFLSQSHDADVNGQTYAEWEARQQPVELPKWLSVLLGIKGCGWVLAVLVFLILVPIIILIVLLYLIFSILCLPYRLTLRFCFPEKYAQMKEEQERQHAKLEEEAQDRMYAHV